MKWAKNNLGANTPESPGLYYSWGNTVGHPNGSGYEFTQEQYNTTPAASIDSDLDLSHDAARIELGSPWRMPTTADFTELEENCTEEWVAFNGVLGRMFTSLINGKTIFFGAFGLFQSADRSGFGINGNYWTSIIDTEGKARRFSFTSTNHIVNTRERFCGLTIRPVLNL